MQNKKKGFYARMETGTTEGFAVLILDGKEYTEDQLREALASDKMEIYEGDEPKRYGLDFHGLHGEDAFIGKDPEGDYVLYKDYSVVRKRLELVLQKIAEIAKDVKLWNGEVQLTGPHCLMFLEDFGDMIKSQMYTEEEATIEARELFIQFAFNHVDADQFAESIERVRRGEMDDMPMLQMAKTALLHRKEPR